MALGFHPQDHKKQINRKHVLAKSQEVASCGARVTNTPQKAQVGPPNEG